jgi:hypothetical protein
MPDFDTRKPQESNAPNTPRNSLVANRLSALLSAGKIRVRSMASTLRRFFVARRHRTFEVLLGVESSH